MVFRPGDFVWHILSVAGIEFGRRAKSCSVKRGSAAAESGKCPYVGRRALVTKWCFKVTGFLPRCIMPTTRKVYAHGELFWWLALLASAVVLLGVLAREARGTRHDSGCPLLTSASPDRPVGTWPSAMISLCPSPRLRSCVVSRKCPAESLVVTHKSDFLWARPSGITTGWLPVHRTIPVLSAGLVSGGRNDCRRCCSVKFANSPAHKPGGAQKQSMLDMMHLVPTVARQLSLLTRQAQRKRAHVDV